MAIKETRESISSRITSLFYNKATADAYAEDTDYQVIRFENDTYCKWGVVLKELNIRGVVI